MVGFVFFGDVGASARLGVVIIMMMIARDGRYLEVQEGPSLLSGVADLITMMAVGRGCAFVGGENDARKSGCKRPSGVCACRPGIVAGPAR